jgi:AcrR family transcriptional regulator
MSRETSRREELAEAATDYVLEHGLIGLSLRPLAAELGTSDRMLLYHFAGKDDLVATILRVSNDRSVATIRALPPARDVRGAVLKLWDAVTEPELVGCQRVYVEAAALGLFGREPYAGVVGAANRVWMAAVTDHLVASGAAPRRAARATVLLESAFSGFLLDLPFDQNGTTTRRAVRDLADAVTAVTAQGSA